MDLSIIIINFNTFDLTSKCIQSIYEKTNNLDFEVILIDNHSSECDPNNFVRRFPAVQLITNKTNLGFSKACNQGILSSTGEFILLLNSDTELHNNAIELSYKRIKNDPSIGVLSSKLIYPNGLIQETASDYPSLKHEIFEFLRINKLKNLIRPPFLRNFNIEQECDWLWGTFFLTRKSIINELGGKLNEDFFMYGEDLLWSWEIRNLKYKILYFPEAIVIHYCGMSDNYNDIEEKYFKKIFPNTFKAVAKQNGKPYTWLLYFIKAIHLLTLRKRSARETAIRYFRILFKKC